MYPISKRPIKSIKPELFLVLTARPRPVLLNLYHSLMLLFLSKCNIIRVSSNRSGLTRVTCISSAAVLLSMLELGRILLTSDDCIDLRTIARKLLLVGQLPVRATVRIGK